MGVLRKTAAPLCHASVAGQALPGRSQALKREGFHGFSSAMAHSESFKIAREDRFGEAPILVFCDHASNAMPDHFECLGLPGDLLETHIAWDIGAAALAEGLARKLGAGFLSCGFSRLIIDANRDPAAGDLIPAVADQIPVPGNQMMTEEDRAERIKEFHTPYHDRLGAAIGKLETEFEKPLAISIHSFTNRLMGAGEERPWGLGFLWRHDEPSARFFMDWLAREAPWPIGDNEPYDARLFNYSVDRHIAPRAMHHVTIEARQDLLTEAESIDAMIDLIARGVGALRKDM